MKVLKDISLCRCVITVVLFMSLSFAARTEELSDSVFTFRFVTGRNMFYSPFKENEGELTRLFECVDLYKDQIMKHKGSVKVNGYCSSGKGSATDMRIAKIRSNRVKSELITRKGLTEECFTTRNQVGSGNYVTVSFSIPKDLIVPAIPEVEMPEVPDVTPGEEENVVDEPLSNYETIQSPESPETTEALDTLVSTVQRRQDSPFALKTNLLDYAILMPNLELEWKFAKRWSVALEGQIAWWSEGSTHKTYRVATVIPEARYWVIERSKWHGMYVGLFGGIGIYDLHKGYTHRGHEGSGFMGGVSAGYMWPIARHLSLDAGLGIGYLRARDKVYAPLDGHFLYQLTKNINYFGPLRLKLSLVWRIPR